MMMVMTMAMSMIIIINSVQTMHIAFLIFMVMAISKVTLRMTISNWMDIFLMLLIMFVILLLNQIMIMILPMLIFMARRSHKLFMIFIEFHYFILGILMYMPLLQTLILMVSALFKLLMVYLETIGTWAKYILFAQFDDSIISFDFIFIFFLRSYLSWMNFAHIVQMGNSLFFENVHFKLI